MFTLTETLLTMWDCTDPLDARDLVDIVELEIRDRAIDHGIPHPFI